MQMIQLYIHTKSNIDIIEDDLQTHFGDAQKWNKQNKMNIHMEKTSSMLIGTRKRTK